MVIVADSESAKAGLLPCSAGAGNYRMFESKQGCTLKVATASKSRGCMFGDSA